MNSRFENYAAEGPHKGFDLVPIPRNPGTFHFTLIHPHFMYWLDSSGNRWIPAHDSYDTDMCSVPIFSHARYGMAGILHDGAYRFHSARRSIDGGKTWMTVTITREMADEFLRVGIRSAPYFGSTFMSELYWLAVRMFGNKFWIKK